MNSKRRSGIITASAPTAWLVPRYSGTAIAAMSSSRSPFDT